MVDLDPFTLRHRRCPAVWSLGDVADHGIRSAGDALRKQVRVLAHNIALTRDGTATDRAPRARFDGYTVMPITVARHRLLLVEVDREGRPARACRSPTS